MKHILGLLVVGLLLSCSGSDGEASQEESVFVDQGTSLYADQDPLNDVMFQAFWWDSYMDSKLSNDGSLYAFLEKQIVGLSNAHIDVLWLPPANEGEGMGYHPRRLFNFNSEHGTEAELKQLTGLLKSRQMHAMADLVFNHRVGTDTWTDFTEPAWPCDAIVMDDEGFTNPDAFGTKPCGDFDEGMAWNGARDLNHKSEAVQLGLKEYLVKLKELGFDSWRYDFVKGFPAKYVGEYNAFTDYYYSVGEFWDGNLDLLKNWVDQTAQTTTEATTEKAGAFDFPLKYKLQDAFVNKNYNVLEQNHSLAALSGYGPKSISFLDNHDSGCINRSDCDNLYSKDLNLIAKGYAYIMTHPGIPMVWGYHYLFSDSSGSLKKQINAFIELRKSQGLHAASKVVVKATQNGASGYYVAEIDGKVLVKIGAGTYSQDASWKESLKGSGYVIYTK